MYEQGASLMQLDTEGDSNCILVKQQILGFGLKGFESFKLFRKGFASPSPQNFGLVASLVKQQILGFGLEGFESFKLFRKGFASPSPQNFGLVASLLHTPLFIILIYMHPIVQCIL